MKRNCHVRTLFTDYDTTVSSMGCSTYSSCVLIYFLEGQCRRPWLFFSKMLASMSTDAVPFQPAQKKRRLNISYPSLPYNTFDAVANFAGEVQTVLNGELEETDFHVILPLVSPHRLSHRFDTESNSVFVIKRSSHTQLKTATLALALDKKSGIYLRY